MSILAEAGPSAEAQEAFDEYRRGLLRRAARGEGLSFKVHQLNGGGKQLCARIDDSESGKAILAEYGGGGEGGLLTLRAVDACPL